MHVVLLMVAIAMLPVEAGSRWRPVAGAVGHPAIEILWMLAAVLGLPYFLLSTTGPLLQSWYARSGESPYRLFALSNAGALIALVSYPLLIEPRLAVHTSGSDLVDWICGVRGVVRLDGVRLNKIGRRNRLPHNSRRERC